MLGTSVSGFLTGLNGSQFASLLTFTANTPSTATLAQTGTNTSGAPMAFTLGADSITNISVHERVQRNAYDYSVDVNPHDNRFD